MTEIRGDDGRLRRRLETWGEVANHLRIEIRTAQRWERKLGLPVRRLQGGQAVYAFVDEIDDWRSSREVSAVKPVDSQPVLEVHSSPRWPIAAIVCGIALLGLIAIVMRRERTVLEPAQLSLQGTSIVAVDAIGSPVWSYDFGEAAAIIDRGHRSGLDRWWRRVDADADGIDEIIAIVGHPGADTVPRERLYCFTLGGHLKYRYDGELSLSFQQQTFNGPWIFMDVEPVAADRSLWIALAQSPWWVGAIVRVDGAGKASLRYTQPGNVRVLAIDKSEPTRVIAAGVNNEFRAASIALLDPAQPPSHAPSAGVGEFACANCPAGAPLKYLLVHPTPLNRADGQPYNRFDSMVVSDTVLAQTYEAGTQSGVVYEFSSGLEITSAIPTDSYWSWTPSRVERTNWYEEVHRPQRVEHRLWSDGVWSTGSIQLHSPSRPPNTP